MNNVDYSSGVPIKNGEFINKCYELVKTKYNLKNYEANDFENRKLCMMVANILHYNSDKLPEINKIEDFELISSTMEPYRKQALQIIEEVRNNK